jgi:hypothetical protein
MDNHIELSSDLSCQSIINDQEQTKIICFIVNEDENIYEISCQMNFIYLLNRKFGYLCFRNQRFTSCNNLSRMFKVH